MIRLNTSEIAKQRQQFVRAGDRVNCSGCRRSKFSIAERTPDGDMSSWRCMLGDFFVTAHAVCNEHEPLKMPATPSQTVPARPKLKNGATIAAAFYDGSEAA